MTFVLHYLHYLIRIGVNQLNYTQVQFYIAVQCASRYSDVFHPKSLHVFLIFTLLAGLHLYSMWSKDCRILNGRIRPKMKKFKAFSSKYPCYKTGA